MHLYVGIYSMTLNQIFSLSAEGIFKTSILQFPLNYACYLPQSGFKVSPQLCTLPVVWVSSRTEGGTTHNERRLAVVLYMIFITCKDVIQWSNTTDDNVFIVISGFCVYHYWSSLWRRTPYWDKHQHCISLIFLMGHLQLARIFVLFWFFFYVEAS